MLFRYYFLIKLYINTWKYSVKTDTNRYKWVQMGVDGCDIVCKARGTQKQGKRGAFRVSQARNWVLWPGKFPRTSCFGRLGQKCQEWV